MCPWKGFSHEKSSMRKDNVYSGVLVPYTHGAMVSFQWRNAVGVSLIKVSYECHD